MRDALALAQRCEEVSGVLKALAHPQRLKILCYLAEDEKTVNELVELCGASQSLVSQFLGRMKKEGLIASERDGQFVSYRISDPRVKKLMRALKNTFCEEDL